MEQHWDTMGPAGLTYFGSVCASMTHELRNSLAIINENAGLLQDLLGMAQQGRPLDPERLAACLGRIQRHVGTANDGLSTLNSFAHLPDEQQAKLDLTEHCTLCVRLHARLATRAGVELTAAQNTESVEIVTSPYFLSQALHECVGEILKGSEGKVELCAEQTADGAAVLFKGGGQVVVTEAMQVLLSMLDARLQDGDAGPRLVFNK